MSIIDTLIFDRTTADSERFLSLRQRLMQGEPLTDDELAEWLGGMRGTYNTTDMNRVGETVEYLKAKALTLTNDLNAYRLALMLDTDPLWTPGDVSDIASKTDWAVSDIPLQTEMETYLQNIRILRAVVPMDSPEPPESMDFLTHHTANNIEESLHMADGAIDAFLDVAIDTMIRAKSAFIYSGDAYTGG